MGIKSKKWYENQIKALQNAINNTSIYLQDGRWYEWGSEKYYKEMIRVCKENQPIRENIEKLYNKLNHLKHEYGLYYRE